MLKPDFVLENETHHVLWDFEIQTDNVISDKRSEQIIINKKKRFYQQSKIDKKEKER